MRWNEKYHEIFNRQPNLMNRLTLQTDLCLHAFLHIFRLYAKMKSENEVISDHLRSHHRRHRGTTTATNNKAVIHKNHRLSSLFTFNLGFQLREFCFADFCLLVISLVVFPLYFFYCWIPISNCLPSKIYNMIICFVRALSFVNHRPKCLN